MATNPSRRTLLGSVGAVVLSGCLGERIENTSPERTTGPNDFDSADSDGSFDDDGSSEDENKSEVTDAPGNDDATRDDSSSKDDESYEDSRSCRQYDQRRSPGQAEPIEEMVTVEETDRLHRECARAAADIALEAADERVDLDLTDPDSWWISAGASGYSEDWDAGITVRTETDSDGDYIVCPPAEFDFDEIVGAVPEEVTVTISPETDDETFTCMHRITVEEVRSSLD
ncbi:hypothetical protein [Natronosalvus halobius]|uniref:hypothetical protein n=1 Tax=Natronosalvus halobius TaxID=2953746 RepID=UPI00209DFFA1|nr:hypothetical protein [Natronosalvus halobius]USZ70363.1 hypothetical protein NGM15_09540 [Natronosalvus halobius]